MRRLLPALATFWILGLTAGSALAQTPAPAPVYKAPSYAGYPTGSGFYGGIGAEADVANSSVAGTSLYSAGAAVDLVVGYQFRLGGNWAAIEAGVTYSGLSGSQVCSIGTATCSIASNWAFSQGVLFGFPWTNVLAYLPNLTAIFGTSPLPAPAGAPAPTGPALPYIGLFVDEAQSSATIASLTGGASGTAWQLTPALALGTINMLPNGVVGDYRLKYEFANSSFNLAGGGVATRGSALTAQALFKF